jgi:hypothetical protein
MTRGCRSYETMWRCVALFLPPIPQRACGVACPPTLSTCTRMKSSSGADVAHKISLLQRHARHGPPISYLSLVLPLSLPSPPLLLAQGLILFSQVSQIYCSPATVGQCTSDEVRRSIQIPYIPLVTLRGSRLAFPAVSVSRARVRTVVSGG